MRWPQKTVAERFWDKVEKAGDNVCWEWTGALNSSGYGSFNIGGKIRSSQRVCYELTRDVDLTPEQHVLHGCDNRRCCNPKHLSIGTNADNVADRVRKGRSARLSLPATKLDWDAVRDIRQRLATGETNTAIARSYGVKQHTVSMIKTGKAWPAYAEGLGT